MTPGLRVLCRFGGLHNFMNWKRGMLTDSGGFQMVSLLHLADVTEEGVTFQSPVDGERKLLTPEESIRIQNAIGADIIMALDDVVSSVHTGEERFEEATHRTTRWIDRCIAAHARPKEQALFGIVQGGLNRRLRDISMDGLIARDENLPGYAVGGLAGGEDKQSFWTVVEHCLSRLPEHKPRYVMGVGYPLDMVVSAALGADMYDCVYPTRTARFGSALVPGGLLNLKRAEFENDQRPVDEDCDCLCCKNYTRAFLHSTATKETIASQLLTIHNIAYTQRLTREMHEAILDGSFGDYVLNYMDVMYPKGDAPKWACDALMYAGIDVRNKRLLEDDEMPTDPSPY